MFLSSMMSYVEFGCLIDISLQFLDGLAILVHLLVDDVLSCLGSFHNVHNFCKLFSIVLEVLFH